jgi:aspartate/methionine/tyrosine aminotransferase
MYLIGAYTSNSKGFIYARKKVAEYLSNVHGVDSNIDNLYMSNGASEVVRTLFTMLIRNESDGILIPIPQYPLYSALITLH